MYFIDALAFDVFDHGDMPYGCLRFGSWQKSARVALTQPHVTVEWRKTFQNTCLGSCYDYLVFMWSQTVYFTFFYSDFEYLFRTVQFIVTRVFKDCVFRSYTQVLVPTAHCMLQILVLLGAYLNATCPGQLKVWWGGNPSIPTKKTKDPFTIVMIGF